MSETAAEPKPKLRWYQYRLAHLSIFVTLVAIACGWFTCRMVKAKRQREAVKAVEELGGAVVFDYEVEADGDVIPAPAPPGPAWFRNTVGVDFLADVVWVALNGSQVSDGWLEQYSPGLTTLEELHLSNTHVTDAGLEHLKGMTNLRMLEICNTQVSDAGLKHLHGLPRLRLLLLHGTQTSDEGVEHFHRAVPSCGVIR